MPNHTGIVDFGPRLEAIEHEPYGLFAFWRFRKWGNAAELEVVLYDKPGGELEPFVARPGAFAFFDDETGRVRHFATRWWRDEALLWRRNENAGGPYQLIKEAVGVRMELLARDLAQHFPDLACEGWLRIPDGDLSEMNTNWATLREASYFS